MELIAIVLMLVSVVTYMLGMEGHWHDFNIFTSITTAMIAVAVASMI